MNIIDEIIQTINMINPTHNSVIVYDIDDTLISYSGKPIIPVIHTYNYAKNKGFIPVIITARAGTEENIDKTKKQLTSHGITDYRYIYFRPENNEDQIVYKLESRKNLHDRGYEVKISIGDMPWDVGAYGGIGFQL